MGGDGHFHMFFSLSHYVIERWREGLLWSFIVGRIGGIDDSWGEREAAQAWAEIGGSPGEQTLEVQPKPRSSLDEDRVTETLKASGFNETRKTQYIFGELL